MSFLFVFIQRAPHFHFALGCTNCIAGPCLEQRSVRVIVTFLSLRISHLAFSKKIFLMFIDFEREAKRERRWGRGRERRRENPKQAPR